MSDKMVNFVEIESDYNFTIAYINFFSISFFVFSLKQTLYKEPICYETSEQDLDVTILEAPCLTFEKKQESKRKTLQINECSLTMFY